MEHEVFNEKAMKRGCRMQTSSLDRFPIDFWNRLGARIVSKSVPRRTWKGVEQDEHFEPRVIVKEVCW